MAEIDTLEVKIKANAQSATASLNSLAGALKNVHNALYGVKDGSDVTQRISRSINDLNNALTGINRSAVANLDVMTDALNRYSNAAEHISGMNIGAVTNAVKELSDSLSIPTQAQMLPRMGGMEEVTSSIEKLVTAIGDFSKSVKDADDKIRQTNKHLDKTNNLFKKLWGSIGRIAMYRAIRSAIKGVTDAFTEGLENAYLYSKQTENFTRLADALDHIKSVTSQLTNQLGAFYGEFVQFVQPAVEWLVENVRKLAEFLTELFAALNGEDSYQYALLQEVEWKKATKEAEKYKKQLLGIDELNNITKKDQETEQAKKAKDAYDLKPVREELKKISKLKDTISDIFSTWTIDIKNLFFDWGDLTGEKIGQKLIDSLDALTYAVVGFSIGGTVGAVVGVLTGTLIKAGIKNIVFSSEQEYDENKIRKLLYKGLGGLIGGYVGFKKKGLKGALVGFSVGTMISGAISDIGFVAKKKMNKSVFADLVAPALNALAAGAAVFTNGIAKKGVAGSAKNALLVGAITFTASMLLENAEFPKSNKTTKSDIAKKIASVLNTLATGAIGAAVGIVATAGSPYGAVIGFSLGIDLGLVWKNLVFEDNPDVNDWRKKLEEQLGIDLNGDDIIGMPVKVTHTPEKVPKMTKGTVPESNQYLDAPEVTVPDTLINVPLVSYKQDENIIKAINDASEKTTVHFDNGFDLQLNPLAPKDSLNLTDELKPTNIIKDTVEDIKDTWQNFTTGISNGVIGETYRWIVDYINKDAMGGIERQGSLFLAGEAGPEFVARMGNSSAVANTEQMTDAIRQAAYAGMSQALRENGGNGLAGYEPATGDDVFLFFRKKANSFNKRTGSNAFA